MAQEGISVPVSPKSTEANEGNLRRNSTGKGSSSWSKEKILPHYLRASTGSCHDFCKYGRKHAFDEKAKNPLPRRVTKKPTDKQNSIDSFPEGERNSVIKLTPRSKTSRADIPDIIKQEVLTKSVDSHITVTNVAVTDRKASMRLLTRSVDGKGPVLGVVKTKTSAGTQELEATRSHVPDISKFSAGKRSSPLHRKETLTSSNAHASKKIIEQNRKSFSKHSGVSLGQTVSESEDVNSPEMHPRSLKAKLSRDISDASSGRRISDVNIGYKTGTSMVAAKKVQVSQRASLSIRTSVSRGANVVMASPRASLSSRPSVSRRPKVVVASPRASASLRSTVSGRVKVLASPRASVSSKHSRNEVSTLNAKKHRDLTVASSENKIKKTDFEKPEINSDNPNHRAEKLKESSNDMVLERTLYVINMENEEKCSETVHGESLPVDSPPPPLSSKSPPHPKSPYSTSHNEEEHEEDEGEEEGESEYTETEGEEHSVSEYDETDLVEEVETVKEGQNRQQRTVGKVPTKDTNGQAVKLRFRRGKVIDSESENNGQWRLKFRRGRVVGGDQISKGENRRSFRRRGADAGADDDKPDSEKVVLRHQDMQEKRDANGFLLNNVIEETASKLVETRKSKVKALVGAFETVISLQDGKPSGNNIS